METKKMINKIQKTAQVSIFIIIGVILIIVSIFLLSQSEIEIFQSKETKLINQISDIVDSCIQTSTEDGVFLLGIQGGTIELSEAQKANPNSYTDIGFKVPSWEINPNSPPTISSMQSQLSNYIKQETFRCANLNLKTLEDVYNFEYENNLQVKSTINEKNVIIETNFPIQFNEINSEEVYNIENYYFNYEGVKLGDLYDLSTQIYSTEIRNDIVANLVLDQIMTASDYSNKNSVPTEGLSFSCAKRIWTKSQIKENIINLNNNNFKFLQFSGTYPNTQIFESNEDLDLTYFENHYTFTLENPKNSFKDYKVDIFVPSSESTNQGNLILNDRFRNFDVTPSTGQIVQSMDMKVDIAGGKVPIPCVQLFHHLYNLDYDVIVKIQDLSEDGNQMTFQFPLRVQIQNNAVSQDFSQIIFTNTQNTVTASSSEFCSNLDLRTQDSKIYGLDIVSNEIVDDVNVSYKCINLQCNLGTTSKPTFQGFIRYGADAYLDTSIPYCIGGELTGERQGYHSTKKIIDSSPDSPTSSQGYYNIEMIPTKTFELNDNSILAVFGGTAASKIQDEDDGSVFVTISNDEYEFESSEIGRASCRERVYAPV